MADIVIKIPEKEFGIEINDKFQDFFKRLKAEIKTRLMSGTTLVCGAYELETIEMFLNAFANAVHIPKDHGRLIILSEDAVKREQTPLSFSCQNWISEVGLSNATVAIIEANKEESEVKE